MDRENPASGAVPVSRIWYGGDKGQEIVREFARFYDSLHELGSDGEIKAAIRECFERQGTTASVERFFGLSEKNKRFFLVRFSKPEVAIGISNRYRLRSFGFDGVLFELQAAPGIDSMPHPG